ncbi:MAG TPA: TlpA disulfide reductase family protein [Bacteroidales bacterium]|jgi:peroxiredoxin|nr:redoxin [Bacteroidota bacterium]HJN05858.1 TlpA disulfide reductase family protein [Bacteroidales bacterium]|tara:strand:- start:174 stop:716 length:543 start_codon:yes stop_codon:yes gene_type:complete
MKKGLFFILSIIIIALISCNEHPVVKGDRGYHVKVGDTVKDINFTLTDGSTLSLSELVGKVIVLQFTASWCSVCRKEMPFLERDVWQKYKDMDFVLIGVDYDEPLDTVIAFVEKMKTSYPMALDPQGDIFAKFAYKNSGVTRNVVIDREGKIAYLTRLFNKEEFDLMKGKIEELIQDQKP